MILAIDTSQADTDIRLLNDGKTSVHKNWPAGRALSRELLPEIEQLLKSASINWSDLAGVIVFSGPGSFTGLRIGHTTANAISYAQNIPIAGASGSDWIAKATVMLNSAKPGVSVLPEYGAPANITIPKK